MTLRLAPLSPRTRASPNGLARPVCIATQRALINGDLSEHSEPSTPNMPPCGSSTRSLKTCQDLNLLNVLIKSARFMTKHTISVWVFVLNLASCLLFAFAKEETRELNNIRSSHLRAVNHSSCGHTSQQLQRPRARSPDEVPLDLKSSVYGCQLYVLNRLFVQHLRSVGSLQHLPVESRARREQRCDLCHRHLNNYDAGDASCRGARR